MYVCTLCGKTFTRSDSLKRHVQTVRHLERRPAIPPQTPPTMAASVPPLQPSTSNSTLPAAGRASVKRLSTIQSNQSPKRAAVQKTCNICNVDIPANTFTAHLNSIAHKNRALTQASIPDCELIESGFRRRLTSYRVTNTDSLSYELFQKKIKPQLIQLIQIEMQKHGSIRANFELFGMYMQQVQEISEIKSFNSKFVNILMGSDLSEIVDNLFDVIMRKSSEFQERDSGWSLSSY